MPKLKLRAYRGRVIDPQRFLRHAATHCLWGHPRGGGARKADDGDIGAAEILVQLRAQLALEKGEEPNAADKAIGE